MIKYIKNAVFVEQCNLKKSSKNEVTGKWETGGVVIYAEQFGIGRPTGSWEGGIVLMQGNLFIYKTTFGLKNCNNYFNGLAHLIFKYIAGTKISNSCDSQLASNGNYFLFFA